MKILNGSIVQFKNGKHGVYLENIYKRYEGENIKNSYFYISGELVEINKTDYTENGINEKEDGLSIVKAYLSYDPIQEIQEREKITLEKVWEKKEKLTIEEIESLLGYKIEIVDEKPEENLIKVELEEKVPFETDADTDKKMEEEVLKKEQPKVEEKEIKTTAWEDWEIDKITDLLEQGKAVSEITDELYKKIGRTKSSVMNKTYEIRRNLKKK